jgi:hypothetical protein
MIAGAAGGLVASWVMNQFQALLSRTTHGSKGRTALNLYNTARRDMASRANCKNAAVHLVYGLTTEIVRREVRRALD